jgi:hypothetical protein
VLTWNGYLTLDNERTDAVFVRAYGNGDAGSVVFAQRCACVAPFQELGYTFLGSDQPLIIAAVRPGVRFRQWRTA